MSANGIPVVLVEYVSDATHQISLYKIVFLPSAPVEGLTYLHANGEESTILEVMYDETYKAYIAECGGEQLPEDNLLEAIGELYEGWKIGRVDHVDNLIDEEEVEGWDC